MTYSRQQAAAVLGLSLATFKRRLASGQIVGTRIGSGQFAELRFSDEQLGLSPEESAHDAPAATPAPVATAVTTLDLQQGLTPAEIDPAEFRDSFGHQLNGNSRHKMFPTQPPAPRADLQAHIPQELRGDRGESAQPFFSEGYTRSGSPLAPGLTQETYDALLADWTRSRGGPSMSQQREAMARSRIVIARSFPTLEPQRSVHTTTNTPNGGKV